MLYLLDTDICSYIIKEHPITVLENLQATVEQGHTLSISVITYSELRLGAERSNNASKYHQLIDEFCERLDDIKPWNKTAADQYAQIQGYLYKQGSPIGANDAMIAGHALSLQATVVTNNQKHFTQVPQLQVANWVQKPVEADSS